MTAWTVMLGALCAGQASPAPEDAHRGNAVYAALRADGASVSAPFILKTRDEAAGDRGTVRVVDLWFVVHARLDEIDPKALNGSAAEGKTVEAGNMRFRAVRLPADDLKRLGVAPAGDTGEG